MEYLKDNEIEKPRNGRLLGFLAPLIVSQVAPSIINLLFDMTRSAVSNPTQAPPTTQAPATPQAPAYPNYQQAFAHPSYPQAPAYPSYQQPTYTQPTYAQPAYAQPAYEPRYLSTQEQAAFIAAMRQHVQQ